MLGVPMCLLTYPCAAIILTIMMIRLLLKLQETLQSKETGIRKLKAQAAQLSSAAGKADLAVEFDTHETQTTPRLAQNY